jgi:hypothetical protein
MMIQTVCIGGQCHGRAIMVDSDREHIPVEVRSLEPVTPIPIGAELPGLVCEMYRRFEFTVDGYCKFVYVHPDWITTRPKPSLSPIFDVLLDLAMHPQIPERIS